MLRKPVSQFDLLGQLDLPRGKLLLTVTGAFSHFAGT